MDYLWLKALHLIAVVCWFAALFYLPRLFVHHALSLEECEQNNNGDGTAIANYLNYRFKEMERKLLRGICLPIGYFNHSIGLGYGVAKCELLL